MTNIELAALDSIKYNLPAIVKELRRMNKLKALELKARAGYDLNVDITKIDDIMGVKE